MLACLLRVLPSVSLARLTLALVSILLGPGHLMACQVACPRTGHWQKLQHRHSQRRYCRRRDLSQSKLATDCVYQRIYQQIGPKYVEGRRPLDRDRGEPIKTGSNCVELKNLFVYRITWGLSDACQKSPCTGHACQVWQYRVLRVRQLGRHQAALKGYITLDAATLILHLSSLLMQHANMIPKELKQCRNKKRLLWRLPIFGLAGLATFTEAPQKCLVYGIYAAKHDKILHLLTSFIRLLKLVIWDSSYQDIALPYMLV